MRHFREALNWGVMLTPSDIFMKSSAVMASIRYLPKDMASTSPEEMAAADEALNRVLMRFADRWSLWFECQRNAIRTYHYYEYKSPVARAIERDRQRYFQMPGNQYENMYVFSMMYKPKSGHVNRVASLYRGGEEADAWLSEYKIFINQFRSVLSSFKQFTHRAEPLVGADLKTYLHNCVSIRQQGVAMSDLPDINLAGSLADCRFTGGYEPMLGTHHLRTIKISGQPAEHYRPGILDVINSAPFPLRNVNRVQTMTVDDVLAEIDLTGSRWDSATKSLMSMVKSGVKKGSEEKKDAFAVLSSLGTNRAAVAVKGGRTSFCRITPTITVHDADLDVVEKRCDWLTDAIRDAGFTCYVARDFDAQPAYMSSLPGHSKPDVGKLFAATINVAKLVPSTAPWTGPNWDEKLDGPPILRCCGLGDTVFRYVLHQPGTPVPHAIVDASTGGGKSSLAGALAFGFGQYPRSNVVFIDFLASAKGITLALEGTFYGFDAGKKVSLQPLRAVDEPDEKVWGVQFMCALFRHMKVDLSTLQMQEINTACDILATRPPHRRTLTNFQSFVQDEKLWDVLDLFVKGGAYGDLLDNDVHSLGGGERIRCYEMASLVKNEDAFGPVLYVIFHEVQRQLNGDPMLFIVDEAQHLKRFGAFREHLEEYLETARKNQMAVILITPNLKEFTTDPKLSALIARSCKTRIFGQNAAAVTNKEDNAAYKSFGLSDERIEVISKLKTATPEDPSHFYTFCHENGSFAVFDAKFTKMQLAFFARNSTEDKAAMDRVLEAGPREEYPQRWLKYCGFTDDEIIEFGFAWKPDMSYYLKTAAE